MLDTLKQRIRFGTSGTSKIKSTTSHHTSYSQCGEDLIIAYIFTILNAEINLYLDIGVHDPRNLNNTYLFYSRGARGVCIEPDPELAQEIMHIRPKDICLNAGVGPQNGKMTFYRMQPTTLNTFDADTARQLAATGIHPILEEIAVDVFPINDVLSLHFPECPQLLSIDVEGLDYDILSHMDFQRFRPTVICAETVTYSPFHLGRKTFETSNLLEANGYLKVADTFINSIFVDMSSWDRREAELSDAHL